MESLKIGQKIGKNHIPVVGIASDNESQTNINGEDKAYEIALCAYYKAEARGYEPGYEMQDWLDAETEIKSETKREKSK
jgi:Protein of unknown function (DUF2934)